MSNHQIPVPGRGLSAPRRDPSRPGWLTLPLAVLFAAMFGISVSFNLLLAALPSYAKSVGAGDVGAGVTTGAFMLAAVLTELLTSRLIVRLGYRTTFALGVVLLGVPTLLLGPVPNIAGILMVCLLRGIGFAIVCVVGGALVAKLAPHERRGQSLGAYGVVVGVPSVVTLATGSWTVAHVGYSWVFTIGAAAALAGLFAVPTLPGRSAASRDRIPLRTAAAAPGMAFPALVFAATTMAAGALVTFLPLALGGGSSKLIVVLFAVQAVATTIARLWSGRYSDRHPRGAQLLAPAVGMAAVGMLLLAVSRSPLSATAGMLVFGVGFGVAQGASLAAMFERVSESGFGAASALWSVAYDSGLGIGATGFGVVSRCTGYSAAFALTAVAMLVILLGLRARHGGAIRQRRLSGYARRAGGATPSPATSWA